MVNCPWLCLIEGKQEVWGFKIFFKHNWTQETIKERRGPLGPTGWAIHMSCFMFWSWHITHSYVQKKIALVTLILCLDGAAWISGNRIFPGIIPHVLPLKKAQFWDVDHLIAGQEPAQRSWEPPQFQDPVEAEQSGVWGNHPRLGGKISDVGGLVN